MRLVNAAYSHTHWGKMGLSSCDVVVLHGLSCHNDSQAPPPHVHHELPASFVQVGSGSLRIAPSGVSLSLWFGEIMFGGLFPPPPPQSVIYDQVTCDRARAHAPHGTMQTRILRSTIGPPPLAIPVTPDSLTKSIQQSRHSQSGVIQGTTTIA